MQSAFHWFGYINRLQAVSLFWKIRGENAKQVSVRACSHACFAFFLAVFEENKDCSRSSISASSRSRDLFRPVMDHLTGVSKNN